MQLKKWQRRSGRGKYLPKFIEIKRWELCFPSIQAKGFKKPYVILKQYCVGSHVMCWNHALHVLEASILCSILTQFKNTMSFVHCF